MQALLAASGAMTPSGSPCPKRSGRLEARVASAYARKLAATIPTPGNTPTTVPMSDARIHVRGRRKVRSAPSSRLPRTLSGRAAEWRAVDNSII